MPGSVGRVRSGIWRHLDGLGFERFELSSGPDGWGLAGTILVLDESGPLEVRYQVRCDEAWRTRRTFVTLRDARGERGLELIADEGRWSTGGVELPSLRGCVDVDLEWSPATNTIPLRRTAPPLGGATGELRMAWVRFPALTVEPVAQEYRRTSEGRYHFVSGGGRFEADIDVDDEGLVVFYPDGWERVGPLERAPTRGATLASGATSGAGRTRT